MKFFEKDVLTTGEVATVCNVAARTVSKWFDSGRLKGYRIPGSRDRRIPVANLVSFMKSHGIPMDGLMSGNTRVLVVDGDEQVTEALCTILARETNYDVRATTSIFGAGAECERFRPHVLLIDIHAGGGDATAVSEWISTSEDLASTKVIAMSRQLTDGQVANLTRQGFDGALRKPFTVRQVIESIETAHAVVY